MMHSALLLLERQNQTATIREDFQRLVNEGVELVGRESMDRIRNQIREGIVQQDIEGLGFDQNG